MQLRTDLAVEAREIAGEELSGVEYTSESTGGIQIEKMIVKTDKAVRTLRKERGTYITIELPPLTDDFKDTDERLLSIGEEIRKLLPVNGLVLVVGLGNTQITPDALGPRAASQILATRHIRGELARSTGLDKLRPVAVLTTGVTGQTGIETGEYICSIVKKLRPNAIVAIDALASRRLARLGCTMQISDTGIAPGAGVGNHRTKINNETMGVPVIAIGVPTVVDASTLAFDLLNIENEQEWQTLLQTLSPNGRSMIVTPKEIDLLIGRAAKLISMSLNCALHEDFELSDILSLI